jgi:hypothetical protein
MTPELYVLWKELIIHFLMVIGGKCAMPHFEKEVTHKTIRLNLRFKSSLGAAQTPTHIMVAKMS